MAMERDLCDNHWSKDLVFRLAKHAKLKIVEVLKATPFHFVRAKLLMALLSWLPIWFSSADMNIMNPVLFFQLFQTLLLLLLLLLLLQLYITVVTTIITMIITTIITIIIGFLLPPRCSKSCFACHTFPWKFLHQPGGSFGRRQRCEDAFWPPGSSPTEMGSRQQLLVLVCW